MAQPSFNGAGWDDPEMVDTTHGLWPAAGLQKTEGSNDNDNETCFWVEYRLDGDLVHRSAHTALKQGLFADGMAGSFS